jgi:hypothetical protein
MDNLDDATSGRDEVLLLTSNRVNNGMDIVIYQDVPMDLCPNFKTHIGYMFISATTDLSAFEPVVRRIRRTFRQYSGLS